MPWKKNESPAADATDAAAADAAGATASGAADAADRGHVPAADDADHARSGKGKAYTPKKGRPTPKRNEIERAHGIRRGPVTPPKTRKEAREQRKQQKASMSKEELKELRARERAERREQRRIADERMAAGDPKYMLPRDQGPERALVRDWVDSRRFFANIFLPFALVLLLIMFVGQAMPQVANIASIISMLMIIGLVVEAITIGKRANKVVRERFPDTDAAGAGLGFYAYSRASQPRRLRTPRPRKNIGDEI
ncbi:DUF3043 domain-containing protein [Corynebacterium hansenii]|uniref:DUF3043 domain-containing protein n=1 Tax=Corynebacterium hansenii TaxID=394964 RepID=A0ABV7ZMQ8_9CORY|nr:DUF3043 domain-containing protein [Corynebacterium hansenii]WJZ00387.1 hypothetical protein CHAN_08895 [Corynebacterium hansenii]